MKKNILINLKRFEVNRENGGVCPSDNPVQWIKNTIQGIIDSGWASNSKIELTVFVPDILLIAAVEQIKTNPAPSIANIRIGSQSCHREDVAVGGNFGAFTSHPLASTQAIVGSKVSLIGHCEERRHLNFILAQYTEAESFCPHTANKVVSDIISEKACRALGQQMKAVICIGETAEERGKGTEQEQLARAKIVLENQIVSSLAKIPPEQLEGNIILAYEPVWAIGPGKTPPNSDYIGLITDFIKQTVNANFKTTPPVVYGGGLKAENAAMLADIHQLDGGLIALTNFIHPIGFQVDELGKILSIYTS